VEQGGLNHGGTEKRMTKKKMPNDKKENARPSLSFCILFFVILGSAVPARFFASPHAGGVRILAVP
jgi:hypothetical protein